MPRLPIRASTATSIDLGEGPLLYFGGCGYLGLAHHPKLLEAADDAARRFGLSSGASRETTGNCTLYDELERDLAARFGVEAALLAPEGYLANLVAIQALADEHRVALIDDAAHPSLFDAARAAQLEVHSCRHGALDEFDEQAATHSERGVVLMTDSVFPSRGELAPARELDAIARRRGATLLLDDCHGTGVIGARGLGVLEREELRAPHVVVTSTFSKALGAYGGFVLGSSERIARARTRSTAYIGSTPPPPSCAGAALAALRLAFDGDALVRDLRRNSAQLADGFRGLGLPTSSELLPVFAFTLRDGDAMDTLHVRLRAAGVFAPYVRYLGSPSAGNFRIVVNSAHRPEDIDRLLESLERELPRNLA